ncbi:glutathione peroxidase [Streptococcus panodentis]|uniref:Glutathione peroxidase n=1 Tax=Streptococcus panodentis TaxID=1581472 RepID=A0ABS5AV29_9STRE|nr:glutathione peroxidase [Streptococcus panodentis]MBP2620425.1 glutathione peroxidase [Streptococcus panodentis]
MTTIYQLPVRKQDGSEQTLADYQGRVLLIVNTATGCGLTPQYQELQELYERYHEAGLDILDFPCNQFAQQAPGNADDINSFCSLTYGTSFPRFAKVKVNGPKAAPLFQWLKKEKGGLLSRDIKWNFTKFLVGRDGQVEQRFSPQTSPRTMEETIQKLLNKKL